MSNKYTYFVTYLHTYLLNFIETHRPPTYVQSFSLMQTILLEEIAPYHALYNVWIGGLSLNLNNTR